MKFFGPCLAPSCVSVWERVGGLEVRRPKVVLRVTRPPTAKLQASARALETSDLATRYKQHHKHNTRQTRSIDDPEDVQPMRLNLAHIKPLIVPAAANEPPPVGAGSMSRGMPSGESTCNLAPIPSHKDLFFAYADAQRLVELARRLPRARADRLHKVAVGREDREPIIPAVDDVKQ